MIDLGLELEKLDREIGLEALQSVINELRSRVTVLEAAMGAEALQWARKKVLMDKEQGK